MLDASIARQLLVDSRHLAADFRCLDCKLQSFAAFFLDDNQLRGDDEPRRSHFARAIAARNVARDHQLLL